MDRVIEASYLSSEKKKPLSREGSFLILTTVFLGESTFMNVDSAWCCPLESSWPKRRRGKGKGGQYASFFSWNFSEAEAEDKGGWCWMLFCIGRIEWYEKWENRTNGRIEQRENRTKGESSFTGRLERWENRTMGDSNKWENHLLGESKKKWENPLENPKERCHWENHNTVMVLCVDWDIKEKKRGGYFFALGYFFGVEESNQYCGESMNWWINESMIKEKRISKVCQCPKVWMLFRSVTLSSGSECGSVVHFPSSGVLCHQIHGTVSWSRNGRGRGSRRRIRIRLRGLVLFSYFFLSFFRECSSNHFGECAKERQVPSFLFLLERRITPCLWQTREPWNAVNLCQGYIDEGKACMDSLWEEMQRRIEQWWAVIGGRGERQYILLVLLSTLFLASTSHQKACCAWKSKVEEGERVVRNCHSLGDWTPFIEVQCVGENRKTGKLRVGQ